MVYSQYADPKREAQDIKKRNRERAEERERRSSGTSTAKDQSLPIYDIAPTGEEIKPVTVTTEKLPAKVITVNTLKSTSSVTPSSVGSPLTPYEEAKRPYNVYEDMSFIDKTKAVAKEYTKPDLWTESAIKFNYTPLTGIKTFLAPLQIYSTSKLGDIKLQDMGGTYSNVYNPNTKTFEKPEQYKGKTGWETIQGEVILSEGAKGRAETKAIAEVKPSYDKQIDDLVKVYQGEIDKGTLTKEQAQTYLDEDIKKYGKKYSLEVQDRYELNLKDEPYYNKWKESYSKANRFIYDVPEAVVTGGLVGASLFGGIPAIAVSGVVGVEGGFTAVRGIQEADYVKAGIGVAMLGVGIYGVGKGTSSYLTQRNINQALNLKPTKTFSYRQEYNKQFYDFYGSVTKGSKATVYRTGYTATEKIVTPSGKIKFGIVGGKSSTTVITKDVWTGRTLYTGGEQTILPSIGSTYGKGGSMFKIKSSTDFTYNLLRNKAGTEFTSGTAKVFSAGEKITTSKPMGGFSVKEGNVIKSYTGEIKSYGYDYTKPTTKYSFDPKTVRGTEFYNKLGEVKVVKDPTFKFNIENIGKTKIVDVTKSANQVYYSDFVKGTPYTGSFSRSDAIVNPLKFSGTPSDVGINKYLVNPLKISGAEGASTLATTPLKTTAPIIFPSFTSSFSTSTSALTAPAVLAPLVVTSSPILETKTKIKSYAITSPTLKDMIKTDTTVITDVKPTTDIISNSGVTTIQKQPSKSISKIIQIPELAPITPLIGGGNFRPPYDFGRNFKIPPFAFVLPKGAGSTGLPKRRIRIRKVVAYTPSFDALVFGIKGARPKGIETGLRVRPIPTGGYNFLNPFTKPKRKKKIIKVKKRKGGKK